MIRDAASPLPELPGPTVLDVDGVPVATYVLVPEDEPSAPDVVLCHGTPWSARVWASVATRLARERRVFLWDMPGYGASIPTGAVSTAPVATDLITQRRRLGALCAAWNLERPVVVAHDIGGAVALGAHLLDGVDMAGLVLVDVVILDPWGSPFFRLVAEHEKVFAALPPRLHTALVAEYIAGAADLEPTRLADLVRPWTGDDGRAAFYRQIGALSPEGTRPIVARLGEVGVPVRILWGEDDPWIPVEQAHRLASLLTGAPEVTVLPGVGHLAPIEAPEAVVDAVGALGEPCTGTGLDSVEPGRGPTTLDRR